MSQPEEVIRRIIRELRQLPEPYLENVYEIVHTLRINLPEVPTQPVHQPQDLPFVDDIETVKDQSRNTPERSGDQHFA